MAAYYGVITNREYLKIRGERVPFWNFLDRQPNGWLTSLAYKSYARGDMPDGKHMIWDCGAWSYRQEDQPQLSKQLVTPAWALEQYTEKAHPGDFVIAPDHMLIPGLGDLEARREFNRTSAEEFLALARSTDLVPMATVHGVTLEERFKIAENFIGLGYTHIALGGLAGQAGSRKMCVEVVTMMRRGFPDVHLHVLGLSALSYSSIWHKIGVNSFDGSSHFKKAFTGGIYYMADENAGLVSFSAARTGEEPTAPLCDCRACAALREEGFDTRRYGSNETNMGRAAHNLNHLLRALEWIKQPKEEIQSSLFPA